MPATIRIMDIRILRALASAITVTHIAATIRIAVAIILIAAAMAFAADMDMAVEVWWQAAMASGAVMLAVGVA